MLRALLPHERLFGVFLVIAWLRLALAGGALRPDSAAWLTLIAAEIVLVRRCLKDPSKLNWRLRLLYHPLAMNASYQLLGVSVPFFNPRTADLFLQRADAFLIGANLSVRLEPFVCRPLTEVMSFCYILFMPYLLLSLLWYFCDELELCRKFYVGLFTLYGLGFLGYTFVPALGPWLARPDWFRVPLEGWWITRVNAQMVLLGSNRVDVFPSLHCAVSSYFLFFDRRHKPWRYRAYLLPCAGLWLSTLYLRYHYFIDVLCGFALAALCLWVAERFAKEKAHDALSRVQ